MLSATKPHPQIIEVPNGGRPVTVFTGEEVQPFQLITDGASTGISVIIDGEDVAYLSDDNPFFSGEAKNVRLSFITDKALPLNVVAIVGSYNKWSDAS